MIGCEKVCFGHQQKEEEQEETQQEQEQVKDEQEEKQGRKMEEEKEVPHLTLDNFHLDSQVRLYSYLGFNVSSKIIC